jgi:hypothetical protein
VEVVVAVQVELAQMVHQLLLVLEEMVVSVLRV